jgi:hypothetical protein
MKPAILGAFAMGVAAGAILVLVLRATPESTPPVDPPGRETARSGVPEPPEAATVPGRLEEPPSDTDPARLENLERSLAEARAEARASLLRGALHLRVGGRSPEQILERVRDVAPDPGMERFSLRPEFVTSAPWMFLHTMVEEDFEEALEACLDHGLRWAAEIGDDEDRAALRDFTERCFRLSADLQRRAETLRRRLREETGGPANEREAMRLRAARLQQQGAAVERARVEGGWRYHSLLSR